MACCLVFHAVHKRPGRDATAGNTAGAAGTAGTAGHHSHGQRGAASEGGDLTEVLLAPHNATDDAPPSPSPSFRSLHSPHAPSRLDISSQSFFVPAHWKLLVTLLHLVPITLADLLATALISYGLLYVPVSTFLMLRHGQLLFAAFIAVVLRRSLNPLHRLGISLSFSGAMLVALSAILAEPQLRVETLTGMGFIVASQLIQTMQLTFEGYFLKDVDMAPMVMVGAEGVLGRD